MELLDPEEKEEFYALCRKMWVAPPPEALPSNLVLSVSVNGLRGRSVFIDRDGIRIGSDKHATNFEWSDVLKWTVVRPERDRIDFYEATLDLPGYSVGFSRHRESKNRKVWEGASAAVVARFLEQHIPEEKTLVVSLTGSPQSLEEVEYHLTRIQRETRVLRDACLLAATVIAMCFLAGDRPQAAAFGVLAAMCVPGLWLMLRPQRQKQAEYLAIRDQLLADAGNEIPEQQ